MSHQNSDIDFAALAQQIKVLAKELGFQQIEITDPDLSCYAPSLREWLAKGYHGEMEYMERHEHMRSHPELLMPGTTRILVARINYLPADTHCLSVLNDSDKAYVSRYALGGDYHKLIRKRLSKLAKQISEIIGPFGYRATADSAPILEKPLAEKAGIGWIGKNTCLINRRAGSWFFLGTLLTDLPLPIDNPAETSHCGSCRACIDVCPTKAIVAPYQLDARRCISYLTIELRGSIPTELRPLMGNRIYGCDDCQLVCPWNKFAKFTEEDNFKPRHDLADSDLLDLFAWSEQEFLQKTLGSAIRRIGYSCWQRNIAVALGNAAPSATIIAALRAKREVADDLVKEHIDWALEQQTTKAV